MWTHRHVDFGIFAKGVSWSLLAVLSAAGQMPGGRSGTVYEAPGGTLTGVSQLEITGRKTRSKLDFTSSDAKFVEGFNRAKTQAMAYAFDNGDPVGPWYEAAEPGREAFCMRDTAHQAMGAHALGLSRENVNMLRRFAENISGSKDWCSFWEIDRYNRAAPVDYHDDAHFWYNLPANFDVLDASYRMFLWSGDLSYIDDPVFRNFYDRTVTDYVERWGLGAAQVMKRPRLLNIRGMLDPDAKLQMARGIPGYDEQTEGYVLGGDVLAAQYDAYLAYAQIQQVIGNSGVAQSFLKKAAEIRTLVNNAWWNGSGRHFYARLNAGHQLEGYGGGEFLYRDVVEPGPKMKAALAEEGTTGKPEPLFKYGDPDEANALLLQMMTPGKSRMEYPEVPFSIIGNVVNGTMGINLDAPPALLSTVEGGWVEIAVTTLSGLGTRIQWAELQNLPIRANYLRVRHVGLTKTTMTNESGPGLIWLAQFRGSYAVLLVNGKPAKAKGEVSPSGERISELRIAVGAGDSVTVEAPNTGTDRRRPPA